ncbi:MAG: hypothetical protein LBM56_00270, partial [Burkholderiaceae bacterium]|nr:hypothetical protein [Burkholderiaceae bacterium]
MKKIVAFLVLLPVMLLSSCMYISVPNVPYVSLPEQYDPAAKLQDARTYLSEGQPLPAERLIMEAIKIYETSDNPDGLGNAYRDFGLFLRSPAIERRTRLYRESGFLDNTITLENRQEKSAEYLDKALVQYQEAATRYQRKGRYDLLCTLYYHQAELYLI